MSKILNPPNGKIDNTSSFIAKLLEIGRRHDERIGRHALTDDTTRIIDMCPVELDRRLLLNSDRCVAYPKAKSAITDYVGHWRHKSDPMEIDETAYPAEKE